MNTPGRKLEFILEYVDDPNGSEDLLRAYTILFSKDLPVTLLKEERRSEPHGISQSILPATDKSSFQV